MRRYAFSKYHGAGNDFVIIGLGQDETFDVPASTIAGWCHRRFGIGADGLITIRTAESEDYIMDYYNADGKIGSMCGNGARCAFRFAQKKGQVRDEAVFRAYDGIHTARALADDTVAVSMRDVHSVEQRDDVCILDTGSPHYVQFVDDLSSVDAAVQARAIRNSAPFRQNGINVNFVQRLPGSLRIRTYERGVEAVTMACGTGVTAAALALAQLEHLDHGPVLVTADGGELSVDFIRKGGSFREVMLTGPAVHVFDGVIEWMD